MSFDTLPNEMLDIILNQSDIPLNERIKLRRISPRCLTVIEDALKKQTKLGIMEICIMHRLDPRNTQNYLHLHDAKYLTAELFHLLGRLFTAVDHFYLSIGSDDFFRQTPGLLHQFSATLKSLDLCSVPFSYFQDRHQYPLNLLPPMAIAINSLTKLTSLSLKAEGLHVSFLINLAPTLARLERFQFIDCELLTHPEIRPHDRHFELVIFTALTDRCTHLELLAADFYWLGPCRVDASLIDLHLMNIATENITQIVLRMPSLRNLALSFECYNGTVHLQTAMFQELSALTQLVELCLKNFKYDAEKISLPSATDKRLSTVKQLDLEMTFEGHDWDESEDDSEDDSDNEDGDKYLAKHVKKDKFNFKHLGKALAAWFPALEQLTVTIEYTHCGKLFSSIDDVMKQYFNVFLSSVEVKIVLEDCDL